LKSFVQFLKGNRSKRKVEEVTTFVEEDEAAVWFFWHIQDSEVNEIAVLFFIRVA